MNKRQTLFILAILILPVLALGAYDQMWGGRIGLGFDLPEISGSTVGLDTQTNLGAWYKGSWSPQANIEADIGMFFDGNFIFGLTTSQEFSYHGLSYSFYPALNKFNFFGTLGMFSYKIGRQLFSDPAHLILSAPGDGIDFAANLGAHRLSAGLGLTALVFNESTGYYTTELDIKKDGVLAASRIYEYLSWELPGATPWLNPSVYFLAVQELSSSGDLKDAGTEKFNTQYLELSTRGFLGSSFLYELSLVGQAGEYGDASILGGIGQLEFSWLPANNSSRLGFDILASTGDDWDRNGYLLASPTSSSLSQYIPLSTVKTQGYVLEFELGNMASMGVFFASKGSEKFSWEVRTTTFLRPVIGPVSSSMVQDNGDTNHFLGQEGLFTFLFRPASDFGWSLRTGVLYPGDSIVLDSELEPYFPVLFRLGFDFSFSF